MSNIKISLSQQQKLKQVLKRDATGGTENPSVQAAPADSTLTLKTEQDDSTLIYQTMGQKKSSTEAHRSLAHSAQSYDQSVCSTTKHKSDLEILNRHSLAVKLINEEEDHLGALQILSPAIYEYVMTNLGKA